MRNIASGLGLLLIVGMMSGCVGSGGSFDVSAPVWEAGYTFSYREEGSSTNAAVAQGRTETEERDWGPQTRVFEVLNTTLEAHGEPIYLTAYAVDDAEEDEGGDEVRPASPDGMVMTDVGFMAVRQRDLLEIPAWLDIDSDCDMNGCTQNVDGLQFGEAHDWSYIDFPLEKGKTWSETVDVDGGDGFFGEIPVEFHGKVVGMKTVSTPLGDVKAIRVDWSMKPVDIEAYKRQVREEADDADANLEEFDISLERSGSLFYSEEYRTVVKSSNRGEYSVEIRGEEGGQEFDFSARGREVHESVLEGARLVPRAERGLDYVMRLATGKASLNNATGLSPDQVNYALKVVADKTVVNAADEESIAFTATVQGAPALPEGHKAKWRIIDADGQTVGSGDGLTYTHKFTKPGEYSAVAESFDATGALATSSAMTVFANYLKTTTVDCPPVPGQIGQNYRSSCESVDVPVHPGAHYLHVVAQVGSTVPNVPGVSAAELFVGDGSGSAETDAMREGDEYSVEIWMFWQYRLDSDPWTAHLRHQRGVLEDVTYIVDVRYDAPPEMPMSMAPSGSGLADSLAGWVANG